VEGAGPTAWGRNADTAPFYGAAAALCFTRSWLLEGGRRVPPLRAHPGAWSPGFAFLVSLHFILPGLVSLASLLTTGPLWRVAFATAGVAGIAALITVIREGATTGPLRRIGPLAWVGLPLYALLVIFAIDPDLAKSTVGLEPLQMEGLLLVFVLLVGIMLAWLLFTYPSEDDQPARHGEL
jgi:hypothetical protein